MPVGATIEIAVTGGAPANTTLQEMVSSFTAVEGGNAVTLVFVPIVDAQAGTVSLLKLYTVPDEESVEFDVLFEEPVVGDGFAPGAVSFTLTDADGNEETVEQRLRGAVRRPGPDRPGGLRDRLPDAPPRLERAHKQPSPAPSDTTPPG